MEIQVDIVAAEENEVAAEQESEMLRLQIACFFDQVAAEDVEEDFSRPPVVRVLAYHQDELIACAEVFKREVEYEGQSTMVGGFGPCTREDWRGRGGGVGTVACKAAIEYLQAQRGAISRLTHRA